MSDGEESTIEALELMLGADGRKKPESKLLYDFFL